MRKVILKPAAVVLYLADTGEAAKVLHFETGDAISVHADYPGLERSKPYPIISYTHTPDGTHVCLPGPMLKAFRVHNEFPAGESREYYLKKMPDTVTELCLPQVVDEVLFHPVNSQKVKRAELPLMRISYTNREKELRQVNQRHDTFKAAA